MKRIMMFIAVFVLMMISIVGLYAQSFSEGFETAVPPTGWTGSGATKSSTFVHGGTYSAYYLNAGNYLITPKLANPGAMTWYVYKGGTGNARSLVETSPDGTTWTERYRGGNDQDGSWVTHTYTFAVTNVYIRF